MKVKVTFRDSKCGQDGFNQTEHHQSTAAHISQEEHDADAATKLWSQCSADHVWVPLRQSTLVSFIHMYVHFSTDSSLIVSGDIITSLVVFLVYISLA